MPGFVMTNGDPDTGKSWRKQSDVEGRQVGGSALSGQTGEKQVNGQFTPKDHDSKRGDPSGDVSRDVLSAMAGPPNDAPPDIEHITVGYQPLSKLVMRLSQETFNELREVIEAMADMSPSQTSNGHNHYKPMNNTAVVNGDDDSPLNIQKKMRLMNFVQDRRAQFIKVLVLAQWSRQSQDVSKVIDLKVWLDKQRFLYDEAGYWLGDLKRSLEPAKMPNPDLRTALAVLSTGKASWLPDLGYVPPPPLTPQQMLKTLQNINILLSIRLNLHETLPPQFNSFNIASGRVTFSVPNEFEVDLSIADEDPNSQFFFIDFRFLFSPTSAELPSERLRNELEGKVNDVLRTEGLNGCYRFLHEFVLTHKINILRRQAVELSRDRWNESIRLETVRRTLVVQYWLNKAGPKSWFVIGISSGRGRGGRVRRTDHDPSTITVRWFADGKEVQDPPIALHLDHLSMEATLKNVVALHANRILSSICEKLLETKVYAERTLSLQQTKSSVEPNDCMLKIQLASSTTATLVIEPVTGRFALLPASAFSLRTELELNNLRNPASEAHRHLLHFRCLWAIDEIESRARCVGWQLWKTLSPRSEDLKRVFPPGTLRVSYFRRNGWRKNWIVAISVGTSGEDWWIIEVLDAPIGYTFGDYERIPIRSGMNRTLDPTYDFLSNLAKVTGGMISSYVNARALSQARINYTIAKDSSSTENGAQFPALLIHFSSLLPHSSNRRWRPWARDMLRVRYHSVSLTSGQITLVTEARLLHPTPQAELIKDRAEDDIVFQPQTGVFAFQVTTPIGESMIEKLRQRLIRIERLISFLTVIGKYNLTCESISLHRIVLIYSSEHHYKVDLSFTGDSPMTLTLSKGNPHLRIKDFLTRLLNDNGLETLTIALNITLPLMRVFDEIERAPPDANAAGGRERELFILPRATDWYQVRYTRPQCTLDIRLRRRRDQLKWFIKENVNAAALAITGSSSINSNMLNNPAAVCGETLSGGGSGIRWIRSAELAESLKSLMNDSADGWIGLRTGIAADINGVVDVLRRVDAMMRRHAGGDHPLAISICPPAGGPGGAGPGAGAG